MSIMWHQRVGAIDSMNRSQVDGRTIASPTSSRTAKSSPQRCRPFLEATALVGGSSCGASRSPSLRDSNSRGRGRYGTRGRGRPCGGKVGRPPMTKKQKERWRKQASSIFEGLLERPWSLKKRFKN